MEEDPSKKQYLLYVEGPVQNKLSHQVEVASNLNPD